MTDVVAILAGIPGFQAAAFGERLSNGPTNASYRVERGGSSFVLRIDKPAAKRLGLDRAAEGDVLRALVRAGLAAPPLYHDPAQGVLLRRFVPGRALSPVALRDPGMLARIARLLRDVHALPPAGRPFDPLGAARRYAGQLGTPRAQALVEAAAEILADLPAAPPVLCHNDPVCGNILENGDALALIDWEYAGGGDPFFDLAVVTGHHDVDPNTVLGFLAAYLGREPLAEDRMRLAGQRRFYRCLLELWRLRVGESPGPV